jgi:hypothetical protein
MPPLQGLEDKASAIEVSRLLTSDDPTGALSAQPLWREDPILISEAWICFEFFGLQGNLG